MTVTGPPDDYADQLKAATYEFLSQSKMDKRAFATLMKLFDPETTEILGDAKFAVEVVKIAEEEDDGLVWLDG
jgi:hypothetical protein